jgi:ABC-2 type transport system ATP-binding protein
MNSIVISVKNLQKRYGLVSAVNGISFDVNQGEIFCIVGPNGTGKTTTLECIEGLRKPDAGGIQILGLDPWQDNYKLRDKIGIQLQESELPERIKIWEALDLFASFYKHPLDWKKLLEELNLQDKAKTFYGKLSGGQKQRLLIALALINNPEVCFLDELTTGLDPQARRIIWDYITAIRNNGTTIVLTTHSMEEAERLATRVAIMNNGKIVALDTPKQLIKNHGHAKNLEDVYLDLTMEKVGNYAKRT